VINANDPTCTWGDIIKFVNWAKTNNYGPFNTQDSEVAPGEGEVHPGGDVQPGVGG